MEIIIFILLLCIIYLLIRKRGKNQKTVPHIQVKFRDDHDPHKTTRRARDHRLKRHTRIWSVLRFMTTYDQLINTTDFHSYERNKSQYEESWGRMRKEHACDSDIETAIRYCRMENFYGTCQHPLSPQEITLIRQWRDIQINEEELLYKVLDSYQEYWNEVLNSYKRPSARKNRLVYLVDDLENIMTLPFLLQYSDVINKIKFLQTSYIQSLEQYQ